MPINPLNYGNNTQWQGSGDEYNQGRGSYLSLDDWARANGKHSSNWTPSVQERDPFAALDAMIDKLTMLMQSTEDINEQLELLQKITALEKEKAAIKSERDGAAAKAQAINESTARRKVKLDEKGNLTNIDTEYNMTGDEAEQKLVETMLRIGRDPSGIIQAGAVGRAADKNVAAEESRSFSAQIKSLTDELSALEKQSIVMEAAKRKDLETYKNWIQRKSAIRRMLDALRGFEGESGAESDPDVDNAVNELLRLAGERGSGKHSALGKLFDPNEW